MNTQWEYVSWILVRSFGPPKTVRISDCATWYLVSRVVYVEETCAKFIVVLKY